MAIPQHVQREKRAKLVPSTRELWPSNPNKRGGKRKGVSVGIDYRQPPGAKGNFQQNGCQVHTRATLFCHGKLASYLTPCLNRSAVPQEPGAHLILYTLFRVLSLPIYYPLSTITSALRNFAPTLPLYCSPSRKEATLQGFQSQRRDEHVD